MDALTRKDAPTSGERLFEDLFRSYYDELCAYAASYVVSAHVAEELVQDLFVDVWERRVERELSEIGRAYLFRALRNRALNHLRRTRVQARWRNWARQAPPRTAPSAADDAQLAVTIAVVRAVIDDLPPRCREVFLLVRREGLRYDEAAEVLGISRKTVDAQMVKAMRALRAALADVDGER